MGMGQCWKKTEKTWKIGGASQKDLKVIRERKNVGAEKLGGEKKKKDGKSLKKVWLYYRP